MDMNENKTITLKELIDFFKYYYIKNVWDKGLKQIYKKCENINDYDTHTNGGKPLDCTIEELSTFSQNLNGDDGFVLRMIYRYQNNGIRDLGIYFNLFVSKYNNKFYMENLKDEVLDRNSFIFLRNLSENDINNFLTQFNFIDLYNYFTNSDICEKSLLTFRYGEHDNNPKTVKVLMDYSYIRIYDDLFDKDIYNKCYYMNGDKYFVEEKSDQSKNVELKKIIKTDPLFLENATINFEELPKYVQDNIYKYEEIRELEKTDLEQNKTSVKKIKNIFKRV